MSTIPALLAPIRELETAATEGPWFASRYYVGSGEDHSDPDAEIAKAGSKADAAFIAAARTDVPRLVAALEAVAGLHRETSQEFITASACIREECDCENECPVEPLPVCHHCWGQLEQIDPYFGEAHHVSEVMWPCPTITAVVAALGGGE